MGDSTCLVHGFSYASALPNETEQGNPMHLLGESISLGRFMTESLSWERWSTFSHKKYVEEAEKYAQPGSVAQKKAFFEAHYKRTAAQKAAALLEQENTAKAEAAEVIDNTNAYDQRRVVLYSQSDCKTPENKNAKEDYGLNGVLENGASGENTLKITSINPLNNPENQDKLPVSESIATPQTERVLHERDIQSARKFSLDSLDKNRLSPNSLGLLMDLTPTKEPDKKITWTPTLTEGVSKYPAVTPLSENRRSRTPLGSSAPGSKTKGSKWRIFSAICYKSSSAPRNKLQSPTPKTEERAVERKQIPEGKFDAGKVEKGKPQKTLKKQAGSGFTKLGRGLCFKARPSPDFYREKETTNTQVKKVETTNTQVKKIPAPKPESPVLGRSSSSKTGTISMPPPPPPPKNGASKNLSRKNTSNTRKSFTNSLPERVAQENESPNIQQ